MSEMIERVAKALYVVAIEPEHDDSWEALPDDWKVDFRKHARAAIEAMREPTEAMIDAGYATSWREDVELSSAWPAMIEAALKTA